MDFGDTPHVNYFRRFGSAYRSMGNHENGVAISNQAAEETIKSTGRQINASGRNYGYAKVRIIVQGYPRRAHTE